MDAPNTANPPTTAPAIMGADESDFEIEGGAVV